MGVVLSTKALLERKRGSNVSIIERDKFRLSRDVLSAKQRQLVVEHGRGNRPQAARELTKAEKDRLFECDEVWSSSSTAPQS